MTTPPTDPFSPSPAETARFSANGGALASVAFLLVACVTLAAVWVWRVPGAAAHSAGERGLLDLPADASEAHSGASGSLDGAPSPSGRRRATLTDPLWDNARDYPTMGGADDTAARGPGGDRNGFGV